MIFSSVSFLVFFGVVLAVLAVTPWRRAKMVFLLLASYFFYAWWDWRFVLLLAGLTLLNYFGARWIHASGEGHSRKGRLAAVIIADLGVLAYFKYAGFFIESADVLLRLIGVRLPLVHVLLPIAISFITFEVIAYVVDVYRKDLAPARLADVGMLVAFFPHLVAGPILRPRSFLPQLNRDVRIERANLNAGAQQFILGLMKKVLVADRLAAFVDPVMAHPSRFDTLTLWIAVVAYAVQIYADFSGYSDMAIGSARCLGFDIPPNFNLPYISRNITEFWRRWHISLSTWLREYLYIPLGGNRKGKTRQAINLMLVMLAAGLWHGASWNFVFWGGLHGVALALHKVWVDRVASRRQPSSGIARHVTNVFATTATFGFVTLAWVFFRIRDFDVAWSVIARLVGVGQHSGVAWYSTYALVLVPLVILAGFLAPRRIASAPQLRPLTFKGAFVATSVIMAFFLFWPTQATPFIYFQF